MAEGFDLTHILLIPSCLPPHKEIEGIAPPEKRLEMARLAVQGHPLFTVSNVELKRSGVSYTIDTVRYFKNTFTPQDAVYLIVGLDAFLELDTWKSYKELFQLIPFIVMERPSPDPHAGTSTNRLPEFIQNKISNAYRFDADRQCYRHPVLHPVYHFHVSLLDISGTKIRACLRKGKSIRFLVPEAVETYMYEQGLYR